MCLVEQTNTTAENDPQNGHHGPISRIMQHSPKGDSGVCNCSQNSSRFLAPPRSCSRFLINFIDLPSISFLTPFSTPKSARWRIEELALALVFSRYLALARFPSISAILGFPEPQKATFSELVMFNLPPAASSIALLSPPASRKLMQRGHYPRKSLPLSSTHRSC